MWISTLDIFTITWDKNLIFFAAWEKYFADSNNQLFQHKFFDLEKKYLKIYIKKNEGPTLTLTETKDENPV